MDFIGKYKIWFTLSGILIVFSIVSLSVWGLNFGLDFKGGNMLELRFSKTTTTENIKNTLDSLEFTKNSTIQKENNNTFIIKTKHLDEENSKRLKSVLNEKIGEYQEIRLESVGPTITQDLTKKAITAVILASIGIIIYIAFAFRSIPKPASSWQFGLAAIIALIHDLFITTGIYSILGHFYGYEVNTMFITALLTILGYSVNDTVIIFDRIRENLKLHHNLSFAKIANLSINQTLARSINTVFTVIIILLCLLIFGGGSIKEFIIVLLIGITFGAYSSIFVAPPILTLWQTKAEKKLQK